MKKFLMLTAAMVASVPGFAFAPAQDKPAVDNEVHQRTLKGETLNMQAAAGKSGGVRADILACSLVDAGNAPKDVVAAMIRNGFETEMVVNGAICRGADRDALMAVALRASGGGLSESGVGFNGANFGPSRAATVGGGGRGSVSGS